MRKLPLLLFIISFYASSAQGNFGRVSEFTKNGGSLEELNKSHQKVLGGDSLQPSVFKDADKFMNGPWLDMFVELAAYLKKNDFSFEKPAMGTHVVYFNKKGKMDHWLYTFYQLPDQKKLDEFNRLLEKFAKKYKIKAKTSVDFYQCTTTDLFMIMNL
jgi:hypothetical protein